MAQNRLAHLRNNPLFRAATIIATFSFLVSVGVFVLPRQIADAAVQTAPAAPPSPGPGLVTAPWVKSLTPPKPRDLVAATFEMLAPTAAQPPATRKVTVTTIRPGDDLAAPAPLTPTIAEAAIAEAAPAEPAVVEVAAVEPAAIETPPAVELPPNTLITVESVNVRSGPARSKSKLFALGDGAKVTVSETHRGWLHITDARGEDGWAYSSSFDKRGVDALTVPAATEIAVATETDTAPAAANDRTVLGKGVTVRSGPGKSYGSLFALAGGSKVSVLENKRGWLRITDTKGRTGWAYKDFMSAG